MFNLTMKNLLATVVFVYFEWSIFLVNSQSTFNVVKYGAKGDGRTDDTLAFQKAWTDACKVSGSLVEVPSPFVFFVKPTTFSGVQCAGNIIFQVDGNIIAPQSIQAWGPLTEEWVKFEDVKGITVQGKGTIDGKGSIWWTPSASPNKPIALSFARCSNMVITNILITNSPSKHLKIFDCVGVKIFGMHILSPENSPNTDGINLSNSQHVNINNVNIACGDDCISILGGCSDVQIYNATCGPSHGISIGSLGKSGAKDIVSGINVHDSIISNSLSGVRIKTWQGGSGSVNQVNFTNIQVNGVVTPIVVDQFYCNGQSGCGIATSAVAISEITYTGVRGTYTYSPASYNCSNSVPCRGITVSGLMLKPTGRPSTTIPICNNAFGVALPNNSPPVTCLSK